MTPAALLLLKAGLRNGAALFRASLRGREFATVYFGSFVDFLGLPGENTAVPPYLQGMFQDPEWMPKTVDSTEPYVYYAIFPYL